MTKPLAVPDNGLMTNTIRRLAPVVIYGSDGAVVEIRCPHCTSNDLALKQITLEWLPLHVDSHGTVLASEDRYKGDSCETDGLVCRNCSTSLTDLPDAIPFEYDF